MTPLPTDRCTRCHLRPTWAGDGTDEPLCWECAVERARLAPLPGECPDCGEVHDPRRVSCEHVRGVLDGVSVGRPEGRAIDRRDIWPWPRGLDDDRLAELDLIDWSAA